MLNRKKSGTNIKQVKIERTERAELKLLINGIVSSVILLMAACQSLPYQPYARNVKKKTQQGGVIALKLEHRNEDLALAQQLMKSNCAEKKIKITEEGEVAIGEKTTAKADQSYDSGSQKTKIGNLFGLPVMSGGRDPSTQSSTEASVTQIKEWQMSYECENDNPKKSAHIL
jgi:hypothetical protein